MNKKIQLILLLFIISSCKDKKTEWLQEYQQTKCAYETTDAKFCKDTLQKTQKLYEQLATINQELKEIEAPFSVKMSLIEKQIEAVKGKYQAEYRRIRDVHDLKYEHQSTPEFEKKVAANESKQINEVAVLTKKIAAIKSEMEGNSKHKEAIEKSKLLLAEIEKLKGISMEKYQAIFDSLQHILNTQNNLYKSILSELKEPEKQDFIKKKDEIKENPCKNL